MLSLTDASQNKTVWQYNALNQVTTETNQLNAARTFQYDANGDVIEETDRDGRVRDFEYNHLGEQTAEKWMSGTTVVNTISTAYNADGSVASAGDSFSNYAYTYNGQGELAGVDNGGTPGAPHVVLSSQYDAAGNRTSLSATIGGVKDFLNSYSYDTLSRLVMMQQQGQTGGNVVASKEIDYGYNAMGDVTSRAAYNFIGVGPRYDDATSAISYNTLGQLTGIAMTSHGGTVTLDNLAYSYDSLGRVSTFGSIDGTATFGYDATSQLTSATYTAAAGHTEPANFSASFDLNGNRTAADGTSTTVGGDNHLSSDGTFTFAYDGEGNLVTRTRISNDAANDFKTTYTWDYRNRLTDVEFYNNSGVLTQHVHYVYDVWDRLIERDLDPNGGGTYTQSVHYVWDNVAQPPSAVGGTGGIVLAFNGTDQLIARYLNGPNTSAYDQFFSTLAEEDVTSTSSGGAVTFPQLDPQGSVFDIADSNGNLVDHIEYSSTGQVVSESNPAILHLTGWQGGIPDAATGMENFDHRWYIAASAVWASQDPLGFGGGDTNLTRSRANDPANFADPTGLAADGEYVPPDINWADARYSAGNEQHDWTNWFSGIPDGLSDAASGAMFNARQSFDQLVDHPIDTLGGAVVGAWNGAIGILSGKTITEGVTDYHTSPTNKEAGRKFGKVAGTAGIEYGVARLAGAVVECSAPMAKARPASRVRTSPPKQPPFDPRGTVGAAKTWTIKGRLNNAGLPTSGRIRYVPRKGYSAMEPLPRGPASGYLDRFGNEWTWDPVKSEWDVQLSRTGKAQLGWLSNSGEHVNVSPQGEVTH